LVDDKMMEFRDFRGCKFDGNEPCKPTDLMLNSTTWPFGSQRIPNQLHGFGSEGLHEPSWLVELKFKLAFHERRAWPCSSMETQKWKNKRNLRIKMKGKMWEV